MKEIRKRLSLRMLVRFLLLTAGYIALILAWYFVSMRICDAFVWQGYEWYYQFCFWLRSNRTVVLLFLSFMGAGAIFLILWWQSLRYLDEIIAAAENIYAQDNQLIELPSPLKELESRLNQIKLNVQENARIAKEAEQRKNDLVVYLAHDLKTPLTSVIGYLTLLRDEEQLSEAMRKKYLSITLDKAERLEDLINEFFEITRFNLSAIVLEYSRINLTRMLEQLISEFGPMLLQKHLTCRLNAEPALMITCDADKLQRVFDNLLRNAVNYSFDSSEITIAVTRTGDTVSIFFENMGNSIPQEKLSHIFEQFYRLDTSRASGSGGAGLGLAIAKEIVEQHHGTIKAYSTEERITFEVRLPLSYENRKKFITIK